MKNIVFFPTIGLPIPAIKGGAIETLITTLIDQNEIEKQYNFIVITSYDKNAALLQQRYKNTEFITIHSKITDSVFLFLYKVLRKITNNRFVPLWLNRTNYRAFKKISNMEIDYCICEGGYYRDFYKISKHFGIDKMILHLHSEFKPNYYIENSFKRYIAVSEFISNQWRRRVENKNIVIKTLYNCIDQERFVKNQNSIDVRKQYNLYGKYVVTYIGRIVPYKGVEQLVKAFQLANISNAVLMIVGSYNFGDSKTSAYANNIKDIAQKSEGKIICTGFVENDFLSAYLKASDLVVMPSLCQEAAGLVAIETLLMGKELITTESGGVVEYAPKEYAHYIEKDKYIQLEEDSDITDDIVLNTDWKYFEDELAKLIIKIYSRQCSDKNKAINYIKKFDKSEYYGEFRKILEEF